MQKILKWKWELIAPGMGVLMSLAFAPYDYSYLIFLPLFFLYQAWSSCTVKRSVGIGYLFGLGLYGSGVWWVYISIHDFGGADPISASLLTMLLVGVWSSFSALNGFCIAKILRLQHVAMRISLSALAWVLIEYFSGNVILNGFPWLEIAYSQLQTPLVGYAPVIGVYGLGFLLAISAFLWVEAARRKLAFKHVLILLLMWPIGAGLKMIHWTEVIGSPVKITLVQGNISQDQKWLPDQKINTLRLYKELTVQNWDSQVIIWPETAIPAFFSQVDEFYLRPLRNEARQHQTDLVVSLLTEGEEKQYYNSVMALGESVGVYQKIHLLPFGEYLPLQPLSGWILDVMHIPLGDFTAGSDKQTLLKAGGYPFTTTICYEDAFGEQVSRQIAESAYIVNVTNDAWFGLSSEPFQHMQMAQMRAVETGRYLVRATNTGLTGFIAPDGRIIKQAPLFSATTLTDTILPMAGLTPYARFGDFAVFSLLFSLVGLISFVSKYHPAK